MKALLLVDIQRDFCPGGPMSVPRGDEVVPISNYLIDSQKYDFVIATQDWHPKDHLFFASQHKRKLAFDVKRLGGKKSILWPDHCVRGTSGADFHSDLNISGLDYIVKRGVDQKTDGYSALRDASPNHRTGLDIYLWHNAINEVDICGLGTDQCIRATIEDFGSMMQGTKIRFIENASRGFLQDRVQFALGEIKSRGVEVVTV